MTPTTPDADDLPALPVWHALFRSGKPGYTADQLRAAQREAIAHHCARAGRAAGVQGEAVLPAGWVPCLITYEGDEPEEVAFGPQRMMDRLTKWLTSYFAHVYAERYPTAPQAETLAVAAPLPQESKPRGEALRLADENARLRKELADFKIGFKAVVSALSVAHYTLALASVAPAATQGEALRLAQVAVRECPDDQVFVCDWMEAAMKACRIIASVAPAASKPSAEIDEELCEKLAALGWQKIVCGMCGSDNARGYPRPTPPATMTEPANAIDVDEVMRLAERLVAAEVGASEGNISEAHCDAARSALHAALTRKDQA